MRALFADLHLHTCFSDGTFSPEELALEAKRHGLDAIAVTDHDSVEACAPLAAACQARAVEFLPATELTAEFDGNELHLLGYLIDPNDRNLLGQLSKFQAVRQNRIREMVARINRMSVPLKAESVFAIANCRSPGRPHVGRALVQGGFCATLDEAFERFLKKNRPAWVPKFKISALEAIELIHQAGGLAVLAHPGLNRTDESVPPLVESGLDGLECYHSKHSISATEHYVKLAERFELLITGGSDCHGYNKGHPLIGTIKLPYEHVRDLKARAARRRSQANRPADLTPAPSPSPE